MNPQDAGAGCPPPLDFQAKTAGLASTALTSAGPTPFVPPSPNDGRTIVAFDGEPPAPVNGPAPVLYRPKPRPGMKVKPVSAGEVQLALKRAGLTMLDLGKVKAHRKLGEWLAVHGAISYGRSKIIQATEGLTALAEQCVKFAVESHDDEVKSGMLNTACEAYSGAVRGANYLLQASQLGAAIDPVAEPGPPKFAPGQAVFPQSAVQINITGEKAVAVATERKL